MKDGLPITDCRLRITNYVLRITFYGLLLTLLLFAVGVVSAQTGEVTDDQVNEVAKDVF